MSGSLLANRWAKSCWPLFTTNYGRYGDRRVHGELVKAGWQVAEVTVLTLMREFALLCRVCHRRRYTSYQG
ncbi:IS3 family transposase [Rhodococcus sp. UFZ-B548]|uniref:IS3 family transposase n=1 Tax=Rhodococcus sp. UFZ-B548 TaxID=2742212 RepID=UPI0037C68DB0